jgi:diguanylate cyclase (GGDEF)-like protein
MAGALTIALIAVSAALGLALMALLVVVLRRSGRATDERIASAVAEMESRMESMVAELSRALVRAEEESRRTRMLGELAGSIDLDEVLDQTLHAAVELVEADAAVIHLPDAAGGRPLMATLGVSSEEAERQGLLAGPPDGRVARAVSVTYMYSAEDLARDETLLRSGVGVPLAHEGEVLGHLAVYTRQTNNGFEDEAIAQLEELVLRAAPAIENARRFREARQLADLDALTGLHNRRYFHETLAREVARAHRYDRRLSLIVLDLDDFKAVNDRIGHLAGDAVLAEAAERMRSVVRSADVPCRVGGDEFAVILPESGLLDAEQLCRRIQHAVAAQPLGQAGTLYVSAGVAELAEREDSRTFFQRGDDALYRAKESGRGRLVEANQGS